MPSKIYDVKAIDEKIEEAQNECKALVALAESEERDMTADEKSVFDANVARIGQPKNGGDKATGLQAERERALFMVDFNKSQAKPIDEVGDSLPKPAAKIPVHAKAKRQLRAFKGPNAELNAFACAQWMLAVGPWRNEKAREWCQNNGHVLGERYALNQQLQQIRAAQTEGTGSEGGFTVPDPLSSTILDVMDEFGVLYRVAQRFPMVADTLNVPKRDTGATVQYPSEGAAITLSDKAFLQVALTAKRRSILTNITNELIADSLIDILDDVAMDAGRELGIAADNEFINGDGTATYGGETGLENVVQASGTHQAAAGINTFAELTLADYSTAAGLLADRYFANASWIMSRTAWAQGAERLIYAAGGNTWMSIEDGRAVHSLFGYPVHFSDQMPAEANSATAAYFGDWRATCALGVRQEISVAFSTDYAFNLNATTMRAETRDNFNVHRDSTNGEGFTRLQLAAS